MSYSNRWLYEQLIVIAPNKVRKGYTPLINATRRNRIYLIYVPDPSEYVISVDVVEKAIELGANTISYAKLWSNPSLEAKAYARDKNVEILPHGAILAMFKEEA